MPLNNDQIKSIRSFLASIQSDNPEEYIKEIREKQRNKFQSFLQSELNLDADYVKMMIDQALRKFGYSQLDWRNMIFDEIISEIIKYLSKNRFGK